MQPWIHKYAPTKTAEIVGHPAAVEHVLSAVKSWSGLSKPLFLWGECGLGKTSTAVAVALELDLEFTEINASDSRNKEAIESLVGGVVRQGSLFGRKKLVLIDEVDGLSGTKDRGGIPALVSVIAKSPFPVLFTGNDPFDQKFKELRKVCDLVEFKTVPHTAIEKRLKLILEKEKVKFSDDALRTIAMSAGGDVRAAINDAQSCSVGGTLWPDLLGERRQTDSMPTALVRVFKSTHASVARGAFDNVEEDVNQVMLWVDQNLPVEYTKPVDLARGYEALSHADVFLGRIRRWQYYRYYVYAYDLLTAGIALAKEEKYKGLTVYKPTTRLLQLWMAKQKYAKKKVIAEKLAAHTHCSTSRALGDVAFLQQIAANDKKMFSSVSECLDLNKEEAEWLGK